MIKIHSTTREILYCMRSDKRLKLIDRGLLDTLVHLPEKWNFSIAGLESILPDGTYAIKASINRLEAFGYVKRNKQPHNSSGQFSNCDIEISLPTGVKSPSTVNPTQYDKNNTDDIDRDSTSEKNVSSKHSVSTTQLACTIDKILSDVGSSELTDNKSSYLSNLAEVRPLTDSETRQITHNVLARIDTITNLPKYVSACVINQASKPPRKSNPVNNKKTNYNIGSKPKRNIFNQIPRRNYDFSAIESMLLQYQ